MIVKVKYLHYGRVEGGFLWESGQKGALLQQHKDQPAKTVAITSGIGGKKRNKEKIRVKILSDKNEVNLSNTEIVRCGQCDKSSASIVSHYRYTVDMFVWCFTFRAVLSAWRTIVSFAIPNFITREP